MAVARAIGGGIVGRAPVGVPATTTTTATSADSNPLSSAYNVIDLTGETFRQAIAVNATTAVVFTQDASVTTTWYARAVSYSGGSYSVGARITLPSGVASVDRIEDDLVAVQYGSTSDNNLYAYGIAVSGTTLTAGSTTLVSNASTNGRYHSICKLGPYKALVSFVNTSPAGTLRALSFSGTNNLTITMGGAITQAGGYANNYMYGVCYVQDGKAVYSVSNGGGDGFEGEAAYIVTESALSLSLGTVTNYGYSVFGYAAGEDNMKRVSSQYILAGAFGPSVVMMDVSGSTMPAGSTLTCRNLGSATNYQKGNNFAYVHSSQTFWFPTNIVLSADAVYKKSTLTGTSANDIYTRPVPVGGSSSVKSIVTLTATLALVLFDSGATFRVRALALS